MNFEQTIESLVGDRLKHGEPLSKHTHYKIGGPATYFVTAKTTDEIVGILNACREHEIAWAVLGGGTNVLVSDEGFDGMIIKMANREADINVETGIVKAGAGMLSASLARQTAGKGLTGFEWAVGLPGTIGGAVRGNAGCFGSDTQVNLVSIEYLDTETGEVGELSVDALNMSYRESVVKHKPWVVLTATFQLGHGEVEAGMQKIEEVLACRMDSQPKNERCAGCAFKNFEFADVQDIAKLQEVLGDQVSPNFIDHKRVPAGWLIDKAGLKGEKIGGAGISEVHGNFITNDGTATADQIAQLIALVKSRVRNQFGIQLHEEIQYIGF